MAPKAKTTMKVKRLRYPNSWSGGAFRAHEGDAGLDLEFAPADQMTRVLRVGETGAFETGIAVQIPEGYAGFVLARSGNARKRGLTLANAVGLIDAGYRGEVEVLLHNLGPDRQMISPGERIAQLVVMKIETPELELVDELDESERGGNGFGSSGS